MKTIVAGAVLFGVAMGGLMYVNSSESKYSWVVAAVWYVLAILIVQFLQPGTTLRESIRRNTVLALIVTGLVFVDTLVLHRGIFKDMSRSGEGLLYRVVALAVAIGVPTAIAGSSLGMVVGRIRNRSNASGPHEFEE